MRARAMPGTEVPIQYLLTLPPRMAEEFEALEGRRRPEWFAACDPAGQPLGSGGGTANLLAEAWRATAPERVVRRLAAPEPQAHPARGRPEPAPARLRARRANCSCPSRCSAGRAASASTSRCSTCNCADYQRVLAHAGPRTAALITSGDVLLRFARELPPFPEVDVLGLGMWVAPEKAKDFGVFFSPRGQPDRAGVLPAETGRGQDPRAGRGLSLPGGHRHVAA